MEANYPLNLKRKDLEDDFSDFSLASPARKIRRLDAELPYRIEEDEWEIPIAFEHSLLPEQMPCDDSHRGIRIEELPSNDEKAIVLFKPTALPCAPSNFSVDHRFISALKNQVPRSDHSIPWRRDDDEASENDSTSSGNGCLAVVPWVPSKFPSEAGPEFHSQANSFEMMDAEEVEEMDIEDGDMEQRNVDGMSLTVAGAETLPGSAAALQCYISDCWVSVKGFDLQLG